MAEYDEGEHVKEVFAYFGRAYYAASCLETGLAMAMLYVDFLAKVGEDFKRDGGKPLTARSMRLTLTPS